MEGLLRIGARAAATKRGAAAARRVSVDSSRLDIAPAISSQLSGNSSPLRNHFSLEPQRSWLKGNRGEEIVSCSSQIDCGTLSDSS